MKKKKGFTLVELLAVIVILAVILVIAVPKIMDTIQNSKEGTLMSSAKLIASQAEKKYVENQVLDINDVISCDDVAKTTDDYDYCNISFDSDGKASVTISGNGKFEGMAICGGTKTEASISDNCYTDEACFAYQVEANEVLVTGYAYQDFACGSDVWVPDTLGGVSVTRIADYAFTTVGVDPSPNPMSNNKKEYSIMPLKNNLYNVDVMPISQMNYNIGITSIKLPSTIEYIGEGAFLDNKITGELDFSNLTNLKSIGAYAFENGLFTSVILPSSVESIGGFAFYTDYYDSDADSNLNRLTKVYVGNPDVNTGSGAFGCLGLDGLDTNLGESKFWCNK